MKNSNSSGNSPQGTPREDGTKRTSDFRVEPIERRVVGGQEIRRENTRERHQPTQDIRSTKRNSMADES